MNIYKKFNKYTYMVLFVSILAGGFIKNYLGIPKSLFTDIILIILSLYALIVFSIRKELALPKITLYFLVFISIAIIIFIFGENQLLEKMLGIKNFIFYINIFLVTYILFKYDSKSLTILSHFLSYFFLFLLSFGIFQSLYGHHLPYDLLVIKGSYVFSFYGTDIIRPTALIGNTIEFSGISLLAFIYFYIRLVLEEKKFFLLLFLLLSVIAIILSYSRIALVGIVMSIFLINFIKDYIFGYLSKNSLRIYVISFFAFIVLLMNGGFLIDRFLNPDDSTIASNLDHLEDTLNALNHIYQHPFLGVGIGTQGSSGFGEKIITDGFLFQIFLEYGIIGGLLYIIFILATIKTIFKNMNRNNIDLFSLFSIISLIIFHIFGLINSSYMSSSVLLLIWFMVGANFVKGGNKIETYSN